MWMAACPGRLQPCGTPVPPGPLAHDVTVEGVQDALVGQLRMVERGRVCGRYSQWQGPRGKQCQEDAMQHSVPAARRVCAADLTCSESNSTHMSLASCTRMGLPLDCRQVEWRQRLQGQRLRRRGRL